MFAANLFSPATAGLQTKSTNGSGMFHKWLWKQCEWTMSPWDVTLMLCSLWEFRVWEQTVDKKINKILEWNRAQHTHLVLSLLSPPSLPSSSRLSILPALPIPTSWPHPKHSFIVSQSKVTITKPSTKCPESCIKGRLCYERVLFELLTICSRKCTSIPFCTHPWSSWLTSVPEMPHGFSGPPPPTGCTKVRTQRSWDTHRVGTLSPFPQTSPKFSTFFKENRYLN